MMTALHFNEKFNLLRAFLKILLKWSTLLWIKLVWNFVELLELIFMHLELRFLQMKSACLLLFEWLVSSFESWKNKSKKWKPHHVWSMQITSWGGYIYSIFALVGMYQKSHLFTALTLDFWYITNSGENALCMPFLEVIYTLCLYHLGKSQSHSVCCL